MHRNLHRNESQFPMREMVNLARRLREVGRVSCRRDERPFAYLFTARAVGRFRGRGLAFPGGAAGGSSDCCHVGRYCSR